MNSGSPITARLSLDIFTLLFAALAILVVIALLWFISYAVENYKKSDNYTEKNKNRPTSRRNINDLSKRARLSKSEKELFTKICTAHPLPNINYALKNREIFDSYLKEAFVQLKKAKSENSKKADNKKKEKSKKEEKAKEKRKDTEKKKDKKIKGTEGRLRTDSIKLKKEADIDKDETNASSNCC